jgi:hypothetical protein
MSKALGLTPSLAEKKKDFHKHWNKMDNDVITSHTGNKK